MPVNKYSARVAAATFVLGISLGPQAMGVAAADASDDQSTSSSTPASASASTSEAAASTGRTTRPRTGRTAAQPAQSPAPAAATGARSPQPATARTAQESRRHNDFQRPSVGVPTQSRASAAPGIDVPIAQPLAASAVIDPPSIPVAQAPLPEAAAPNPTPATAPNPAASRMVARTVQSATATASSTAILSVPADATAAAKWLSGLFAPFQNIVNGFGLQIRRTFFNKAPTVNPVQLTGQISGPITGTVGAVDPELDPITYSVTQAPLYGSVSVAADGSYIYTPGNSFTGFDSFNVSASDGGHLNLLDLKRPDSTEAYLQVAQGAGGPKVTFNFIYGSGSQYWSSAARSALEAAATRLASYFVVSSPVALTFDVTGTKSPFSTTLASAGSDLVDGSAGFFATVVQQKVLTGIDPNGSAADGTIDWNFGQPWAMGSSVAPSEYDFTSTAMHELVHTFGFLSNLDKPGSNTGQNWTLFDGMITTNNGTRPFTGASWNTAYNSYLTGSNGGLYFNGPHAVAVYGGPVPLYTPSPWESGSSMSHLDDNTFFGNKDSLMAATVSRGVSLRVLSPVELAMLQDLGYTVNSNPVYALLFLGLGFLRRRKQPLTNAR